MNVRDIMTSNVVTIPSNTSIADAKGSCGSAPLPTVTSGGQGETGRHRNRTQAGKCLSIQSHLTNSLGTKLPAE